ncbi:MAG: H-NS histone family protein [Paracoccaceae bacterium]|nr:H-NS histone family protein [Paracoccaceae bacterium]
MAKVNLSKMSLAELKSLQKDVAKAIQGFEKRKRDDAMKALQAVAKEHGMTLDQIVSGGGGKKKRAGAPAKYRNPANAGETWSGRGRQPKWYKDAVKGGASPDSMLI